MSCTLADEFVVRSPLFAAATITSVLAGPSLRDSELARLFADPLAQEAMFLASPVLYDEVRRWLAGTLRRPDQAGGVRRSLLKYLIRMSTRSTPFGLFAGCSSGSFGAVSSGTLPGRDTIRRSVRLDMGVFCALARTLGATPEVRNRLKVVPNSTLYIVGQEARFFDYSYDEHQGRRYGLASVEVNRYLRVILETAGPGVAVEDLAKATADAEVNLEDAARYVHDLVENQVLTSELEPAVTDPRFLERTIALLPESDTGPRGALERIAAALRRCSDERPDAMDEYNAARIAVSALIPGVSNDAVVHVDVFKPADLHLGPDVRAQVLAGLDAINRLTPRAPLERLEKFRKAFRDRFEDRQVPLLLAVDAEIGVPYGGRSAMPASLLEGLEADDTPTTDDETISLNAVEQALLPKIWDTLLGGRDEVRLQDGDLGSSPANWDDLPATFSVSFSLLSRGGRRVIALHGAGGATAAAMLGRFAHLDERFRRQMNVITEHERSLHAGKVVAEVLHLPDDRVGNVLIRPSFRTHEIPCLARAAVGAQQVVALNEITLSAPHAGRIRLWSNRLECEVIPVLSNAHRFDADELLPVYRLLCDLQAQGLRTRLGLPWARLLKVVPRLPRVVYRDCILSPARWWFDKNALGRLVERVSGPREAFVEWQRQQRLPDEVLLSEQDNELYLNLANADCRELLASELRRKKSAMLVEYLFTEGPQWITGADGGYCHEVVASCLRGPAAVASRDE